MNAKRLLWEPAIYEHKAALIHRDVEEVACSAKLLAEAVLAEHEIYQADFVTVGVDVYNVEVEACGAELISTGPAACPEIADTPFDLANLPEHLKLPDVPQAGRFGLLLEAGTRVVEQIGDACAVRVAASGPASIAAKLVGLEKLVMGLALGDEVAGRILEFAAGITEAWCSALRAAGLDVILFDSVAAPPVMSPDMYAAAIHPLHKRILSLLGQLGQEDRPLVIGGDTTALLANLASSGATTLLCDFPADARAFAAALPQDSPLQVRRNVNPQALAASDQDLQAHGEQLANDLQFFPRPIAGTGVLPYDADPERFKTLRKIVDETFAARSDSA